MNQFLKMIKRFRLVYEFRYCSAASIS